jgi:hypothetical protein
LGKDFSRGYSAHDAGTEIFKTLLGLGEPELFDLLGRLGLLFETCQQPNGKPRSLSFRELKCLVLNLG